MTFKEQLSSDLTQVFMNTNEFAEMHQLGTQEVPLIIDDDELQKRQLKAAEGVYLGEVLLLVESRHLNKRPVEGQRMKFDGEIYFVFSCAYKDGLYEIALGRNMS